MNAAMRRLLALALLDTQQIMGALEGGQKVDAWQYSFTNMLAQYHTAAFIVGQDGKVEIGGPAKTWLGNTLEDQLGFLKKWGLEIESDAEFKLGWNARAALYAQGIGQSYWKGATKMLPLPAMPRDGTSQCLGNCTCSWDIQQLDGEGNYDCYWKLGAAERHCQTCPQRAADWSPLKIRKGELQ
jgi:hypothetical protein